MYLQDRRVEPHSDSLQHHIVLQKTQASVYTESYLIPSGNAAI
jgi:hypothetical protein